MNFLLYPLLANMILVASLIYVWHDLLNRKIDFKDKRLYITFISIVVISILNYLFVDKIIKILLITIVFMIFFRYLFKENINRCIITPIYYQMLIMIVETIYIGIAVMIFGNDAEIIMSTCFGTFAINFFVALLSILAVKIKFVKRIYNRLISITEKIKINILFMISLGVLIIANILAVASYYKFDFKYILVINSTITLGCSVIIYYIFKTQNNYNKVSDKYNIAVNSLMEYEEMINKYRVSNHENKNLLLTIRAMILNKEKNI